MNFDTRLKGLDLHTRSKKHEKAENVAPIIEQSFQLAQMKFDVLFGFVDLTYLISDLACPVNEGFWTRVVYLDCITCLKV